MHSAISGGTPDPTTLFVRQAGQGGHAITPYALGDMGNGIYRVHVYDNNYPNDANRYVIINTSKNTWSYNLGWTTWSGDSNTHTLGIVPISKYTEQPVCPWCGNGSLRATNDSPSGEVWLSGQGHLLITDSQGRQIGYVGNNIVREIPNAYESIVDSGLGIESEPIYTLPMSQTYQIQVNGETLTQTGVVSITQFGPGYAVSIDNVRLDPATRDLLMISQDGKQVAFQPGINSSQFIRGMDDARAVVSPTLSLALDSSTDSSEFTLQGTDVALGQVITVTAQTDTKEIVVNNIIGIDGSYDLLINQISASGEYAYVHPNVAINASDTQYLDYSGLVTSGIITMTVDVGSTGTMTQTIILYNSVINPKVQIVTYNPWLASVGMYLFEYESGFDPSVTSEQVRSDIYEASNGYVNLQIVGRVDRNEFPMMTNGLRMTESEYLQFRAEGKSYSSYYPGAVIDMNRMVEDDALDTMIKNHEIDEIWMFLSWQMSGYESRMGGPGAFWINGPTFQADSGRAFAVMGFENAVGVPNSLHSMGHRIESTLYKAYSADQDTPWARFRKNPSYSSDWLPGVPMGVGDVHHPPNTNLDYDYTNQTLVNSTADDWYNFPNLTGKTQPVNAQVWGNTDYGYYKWWFSHLPLAEGVSPRADSTPNQLRQNNWWKYIFQYYQYPELVGSKLVLSPDPGTAIAGELVIYTATVETAPEGSWDVTAGAMFTSTPAAGGIWRGYVYTTELPGIWMVRGQYGVLMATTSLTVYAPAHADFSATPVSGVAPFSVTFTNLSGGDYDTCAWTFGDGGSSNQCAPGAHTYAASGIYTVTLAVSGLGGTDTEMKTNYVTVYGFVQADFEAAPTFGAAPLPVNFTNHSSGDFHACLWSFGNGTTDTNCSPTYTYHDPGVYTVTLTVDGPGGTDTESRVSYISVIEGLQATLERDTPGTLIYTDTQGNPTTIHIPAGAVTDTTVLIYTPSDAVTTPDGFIFAGHAFDLKAYRNTLLMEGFAFEKSISITIQYSDDDVQGLDESALLLEWWNESSNSWKEAACGAYERHPEANWLRVPICHLSRFAVFGNTLTEEYKIYLPLVQRNNLGSVTKQSLKPSAVLLIADRQR